MNQSHPFRNIICIRNGPKSKDDSRASLSTREKTIKSSLHHSLISLFIIIRLLSPSPHPLLLSLRCPKRGLSSLKDVEQQWNEMTMSRFESVFSNIITPNNITNLNSSILTHVFQNPPLHHTGISSSQMLTKILTSKLTPNTPTINHSQLLEYFNRKCSMHRR